MTDILFLMIKSKLAAKIKMDALYVFTARTLITVKSQTWRKFTVAQYLDRAE